MQNFAKFWRGGHFFRTPDPGNLGPFFFGDLRKHENMSFAPKLKFPPVFASDVKTWKSAPRDRKSAKNRWKVSTGFWKFPVEIRLGVFLLKFPRFNCPERFLILPTLTPRSGGARPRFSLKKNTRKFEKKKKKPLFFGGAKFRVFLKIETARPYWKFRHKKKPVP